MSHSKSHAVHQRASAAGVATDKISAAEQGAIRKRRQKAGVPGEAKRTWGLALSGGGVRSATFCLGLVRALAANKLLHRFDYLSTVSGGGYLGASLGRLFGDARTPAQTEAGVASDNSLWLWWLRSNGRYLTPAGAKDLSFAGASITRGILATHAELAALMLLLAAIVLMPHLVASLAAEYGWLWAMNLAVLSTFGSAWWWLAIVPMFLVTSQLYAYWLYRQRRGLPGKILIGAAVGITAVIGVNQWQQATSDYALFVDGISVESASRIAWRVWLTPLLLAPAAGFLFALATQSEPEQKVRLQRTKSLATCMWALTIFVALGLLDVVSWRLADLFWRVSNARPTLGTLAVVAAAVAIGRLSLPTIKAALAQSKLVKINLERLINIVGVVAIAVVVVIWMTAFHILMLPREIWLPTTAPTPFLWSGVWTGLKDFELPGLVAVQGHYVQLFRWAFLLAVPLLYVFCSRRNFDVLNLASLHNFYRGRIERAYISAGNWGSSTSRFKQDPLMPVGQVHKRDVAPLVESIDGDDVLIAEYAPHKYGGPIHLINCCINQSVDDRTENYNADRKGVPLTISSLGVEAGSSMAVELANEAHLGGLAKWIAISGAAASTGMGSNTSPGMAAMLFMSGLRLGYWTPALLPLEDGKSERNAWSKSASRWIFKHFSKPVAIVSEFLARFPGLNSPAWYVSDGGHFDNTGILPLIKREVDIIVAADCGADPKYLFSDLESLVRKADIDYGAGIEFLDAGSVQGCAAQSACIGTPESMGPESTNQCLVVGRINYRSGKIGTLIVVKPVRLEQAPFDIVAYADRNSTFPQQTTSDQFFDESQWESYQRLGHLIGMKLDLRLIAGAAGLVADSQTTTSKLSAAIATSEREKSSRQSRVSSTVKASIGAGISISVLLGIWQGIQQYKASELNLRTDYLEALGVMETKLSAAGITGLNSQQFDYLKRDIKKYGAQKRYENIVGQLAAKCKGLSAIHPQGSPETNSCKDLLASASLVSPLSYWMEDVKFAPIAKQTDAAARLPKEAARNEEERSKETVPERAACGTATLYVHIYDEESRMAGEKVVTYAQMTGIGIGGIENVVATAARRGKVSPYVWKRPTIVYHSAVPLDCITRLLSMLPPESGSLPLPTSLTSSPGIIELWLPRGISEKVIREATLSPVPKTKLRSDKGGREDTDGGKSSRSGKPE